MPSASQLVSQIASLRGMLPPATRLILLAVADPFAVNAPYLSHAWRRTVRNLPLPLCESLSAHVAALCSAAAAAAATLPNTRIVERAAVLCEGDLQEWTHMSRRGTARVAAAVLDAYMADSQGEGAIGTSSSAHESSRDADGDLDVERPLRAAGQKRRRQQTATCVCSDKNVSA